MSIFKYRAKLARKVKRAFLARGRGMTRALRKLEKQEQEIAALRRALARRDAGEPGGSVLPENVVWIFGSGRTGSSWLAFMMGALPNHTRWNEPLVGNLFGHLYYERAWPRQEKKHFILANNYEENWLGAIRSLVLDGGTMRFPQRAGNGYLVIKEPHGSLGARLLMKALPESRMIFLVRDPRDVVASALAVSFVEKGGRDRSARVEQASKHPEEFARSRARSYRVDIRHVRQAFDDHEGPKVLVRYEDLRADTLGTMKRIYSALEIPMDEGKLARTVEEHLFENIAEEEKGEGTIRRKATPKAWQEDLTLEQIRIVEEEAAQVLDQFYGGDRYAE